MDMSLLWAVPPVAVTVATLIAIVQLRGIADATDDLATQLRRLDEVRVAVAQVRSASSEARATARGLRLH
jgi:ribosomal protein L30/L7E